MQIYYSGDEGTITESPKNLSEEFEFTQISYPENSYHTSITFEIEPLEGAQLELKCYVTPNVASKYA